MSKSRKILALILNIIIVLLETISLTICFCNDGISSFQYFTVDSNIIAFFASLLYSIFTIVDLVYETDKIPKIVDYLKYIASTCLLITIVVVLTVLVPTMGGVEEMLLKDAMLYHHVLCPVLTIVSYVLVEKQNIRGVKSAFIPFSLTLLYGVIMIVLNIMGKISGPYPFLKVTENSVISSVLWLVLLLVGSYAFGYVLNLVNKKTTIK